MSGLLTVSETYLWDEQTDEFIDRITMQRFPASSFEMKVNVYETRVRQWFLNLAVDHVSQGESPGDYIGLSIALAYIEGVEQYRRGTKTPGNQSGNWFKSSARRVFPGVPTEAISRLWRDARCGLFHTGFTDGPTYVSHGAAHVMRINQGQLVINPRMFVEATVADFGKYLDALRAHPSGELAVNFERLWDYRWENS